MTPSIEHLSDLALAAAAEATHSKAAAALASAHAARDVVIQAGPSTAAPGEIGAPRAATSATTDAEDLAFSTPISPACSTCSGGAMPGSGAGALSRDAADAADGKARIRPRGGAALEAALLSRAEEVARR